tara:strand:- start:593 stop:718 length:126 start_codon:yes stop_codon:yes gene_type:complete
VVVELVVEEPVVVEQVVIELQDMDQPLFKEQHYLHNMELMT